MDTATKVCRGLVLAGGGARGSYQIGVWRALDELGWTAGAVTGTSVGCLNGAMYALGQYETARDMWLTIHSGDVMELPDPAAGPRALGEAVRQIVAEGGLDISPLEGIVARVLDEEALRASPVRFGLVTVEKRGLRPRELTLEEIPRGQLADYLLASAACYPAMPARNIDGVEYLDGGYFNNMPTGLAARLQNQVGHAQLAVGLLDDLLVHRLADLDLQLLSLGIVVVFIVEFRHADPAGERSLQDFAYFFFFFFFPSSSLSLSYASPS